LALGGKQPASTARNKRRFSAALTAMFAPCFPQALPYFVRLNRAGSPVKAVGSGSRSGFVTSFSGFVTPLLPLFFENPAPILLKQQAI